MNKNRPIYTAIITIIAMIFSIVLIVLLAISYSKTTQYDRYFSDTRVNHQIVGYDEIKVQKIPCSQDYQSIISHKTPGIEAHKKRMFENYRTGSCKIDDIICTDYKSMDAITIENIKGLFFCGRKTSINFMQTLTSNKDGKCPNNYKVCGKDSQQNICYPSNINCPINDIQIHYDKQDHLIQANYKEQQISDNQDQILFVYTSNEQTSNQIPVEFRIGYQQMCVDPEEEIAPRTQFKFFQKNYLKQCKTNLGKYDVDDRFKNMYTFNRLQLYKDNDIFDELDEYYDAFEPDSINYDVSLFSRTIIHFDESCKQFFYQNSENSNFKQTSIENIPYFKGFLIYCFTAFSIHLE